MRYSKSSPFGEHANLRYDTLAQKGISAILAQYRATAGRGDAIPPSVILFLSSVARYGG